LTVFLKPLLKRPNARLFAGLKVIKLERTHPSRVNAVCAVRCDTGERFRFTARCFVIAANAIQSAALLLRSADRWSPAGLGNENDMVGRGLCMKMSEYVAGYYESPGRQQPEANGVGPFSTLSITDHYLDPSIPTGLGGLIYEARYGQPYAMARGSVLRLETILADQPSRNNRIRLDSALDRHGVPGVIMDYQVHPRDLVRLESMVDRCHDILKAAGCKRIWREPSGFAQGSGHLHGTCRAGTDRKTSTLDADSRLHEIDNVYVADGSFMPYPGGVNPTLTIQAHAMRTAKRMLAALPKGK
jgi:paromamine 6'-oxidase/6'''-hydroxyneomycin C oxidase/2'-deamino-2'-hydroxyparomamine 6'-oxidase